MNELRNLLGPLRVLDAMVRAGGIARAAAQLHVTPGAVSQQLKQLEGALGVALFTKAGRSLEPTTAGRQLARRLADLFDRIEAVIAETTLLAREQRLRVKVSPDFAVKWLMPRLAGFYAAHGDIDLDIATSSRADDVHLDNADFVIRFGNGEWEDVHSELLFMNELVPVCAPALAASIRAPHDVLNFKLIHSMRRPEAWSAWLEAVGLGLGPSSRTMALANSTLCIQAAADAMKEGGVIVNVASSAGYLGIKHALIYCGIKAGVIGLTRSAATELGERGIRVNAVAPGSTKTEGVASKLTPEKLATRLVRVPLGRLGEVEDIANTIFFLSSDEASYITGEVITIDGGITRAFF